MALICMAWKCLVPLSLIAGQRKPSQVGSMHARAPSAALQLPPPPTQNRCQRCVVDTSAPRPLLMLGRVVPWASWGEWNAVRHGLYSESVMQQQEALDKVKYRACSHPCSECLHVLLVQLSSMPACAGPGLALPRPHSSWR